MRNHDAVTQCHPFSVTAQNVHWGGMELWRRRKQPVVKGYKEREKGEEEEEERLLRSLESIRISLSRHTNGRVPYY